MQHNLFDNLIELKRYNNRKLYCYNTSSYVTLQDVVEFIQQGKVIVANDSKGKCIVNSLLKSALEHINISNEEIVDIIRNKCES